MPQASAKSNTVQPDKPNEPIFTPRFIAGFAVNFILYMQYYALMVAMAGYSAMQFAAGATEGGFTASVFILGALCSRLFFGGVIDKVGRGRVLVACMTVFADLLMQAQALLMQMGGRQFIAASTTASST